MWWCVLWGFGGVLGGLGRFGVLGSRGGGFLVREGWLFGSNKVFFEGFCRLKLCNVSVDICVIFF